MRYRLGVTTAHTIEESPTAAAYHLDCSSGLAGDMFLGACLDLGMPMALLEEAVDGLGLGDVTLEQRRAVRGGLEGCRFRVLRHGVPIEGPDPEEGAALGDGPEWGGATPGEQASSDQSHQHSPHEHHHHEPARDLEGIRRLIKNSSLRSEVSELAVDWFERLGAVEARMHGIAIEKVHFHEVGAVDSIVDIVGAAVAVLDYLKPQRVTCSDVVVGSGRVRTAHGVLPVPAPATAELLLGVPIKPGPKGELVTPTGALLLDRLVDDYTAAPEMVFRGHGYGLGRYDLKDRPNVVRLSRGDVGGRETNDVVVIECQLDDLAGEGFGYLLECLLEQGALDVYYTPVQMKKGRPGVLVTVLARPEHLEELAARLMLESGGLGCRYVTMHRFEAEREMASVETPFGEVRVKRAWFRGRALGATPEFEDCRSLARAQGVAWREVYRAALAAAVADEAEWS